MKEVKASEVGLGNVPPSVTPTGGVTMSHAVQSTALSLAGVRTLRFPVGGERTPERNEAGLPLKVTMLGSARVLIIPAFCSESIMSIEADLTIVDGRVAFERR